MVGVITAAWDSDADRLTPRPPPGCSMKGGKGGRKGWSRSPVFRPCHSGARLRRYRPVRSPTPRPDGNPSRNRSSLTRPCYPPPTTPRSTTPRPTTPAKPPMAPTRSPPVQILGTPYSWAVGGIAGPGNGIGPGSATVGFDACSLVHYAHHGPPDGYCPGSPMPKPSPCPRAGRIAAKGQGSAVLPLPRRRAGPR